MKYRGIFEYEYPTEHKPPVSINVYLHGDCVKGKIIEWEYRPLEQESVLDRIRAEIEELDYITFDGITKRRCLEIIDKYKAESEK